MHYKLINTSPSLKSPVAKKSTQGFFIANSNLNEAGIGEITG